MPRQIVRLVLAVLILASLFGGRSLVANLADGAQHVVKPGDTLSGIAAQYGVTVEQLTGLNGITDPDRLNLGQVLKLPTTARTPAPAPDGASTSAQASNPPANSSPASQAPPQASAKPSGAAAEYVVQSGDTLSGIAKSLGVTMKALLDANELADPDRLRVGQKLAVPAGATTPASAGRPSQPATSTANTNTQPGQQATAGQQTPPADEVSVALDRLAQQYNVDPALVRALAWIESDGKPYRPDSAGGVGHLTVTDKTFEYIQQALVKRTLDRANPTDNLEAGIAYVAAMLKWGGEEPKGLAGFLQGPGSVRANGVRPAIEEQVKRILALRDRLKQGLPAPTTAGPAASPGQGTSTATQGTAATAQGASAANTAGPAAGSGRTAQTAPVTRPATGQAAAEPKLVSGESTANLTARSIGAARAVAGANAQIGISGRHLVTGERLDVSADQTFPAASVAKLGLMVEAYRQTSGGALTLNEVQRADLKAMIVSSDNDAANRLMELLSTRAVNANLQALGLIGTRLVNPFGMARTTGSPSNVTTPRDMSRLMELLATEQLVSAQASREMRSLLLQSNDGSKLRRGLPPEARLAHKSGWYDGVANDVGIVTHPQGSYVLSVFTEGINDGETANQTIAAVAEAVHAIWGPKPGAEAAAAPPQR